MNTHDHPALPGAWPDTCRYCGEAIYPYPGGQRYDLTRYPAGWSHGP